MFVPLRVTISGNSQKSVGATSGQQCGCSISVMNFWARNCLTAPCGLEQYNGGGSNLWAKVQVFFDAELHVTASKFPHKPGWLFGLVKWIQSVMGTVFIYDFDTRAFSGRKDVDCFHCKLCRLLLGIVLTAPRFICVDKFTHNLMIIRCSKNRSLIFATIHRNTRVSSAP